MRDDGRIILAEWAWRTNAETRRVMGVSISELPAPDALVDPRLVFLARAWARFVLVEAGEMDLDEAATLLSEPGDDWPGWDREAWASAAREYHANRRGRR